MNLREKVENLLLVAEALAGHCPSEKEEIRVDGQIRAYREVIALMNEEKMNTGLFDKNFTPINFRNFSDTELANYYVDVCAYREIEAIEQQKAICKIMVERFIDKYADKPIDLVR